MRNAPSSRTARIERGVPPTTRSCGRAAGTLCPNVPPKPGVDVCDSTRMESDADVMRIAPKSLVREKTDPRTSANVVDLPAPSGNVDSAPPRPSALLPRNFRTNVVSDAPVFATVRSVV